MTERRSLILFEDDVNRVVQALGPYQERTRTRANLLMDTEGHVLAQTGKPDVQLETIAALVAASVSATRNVAGILAPDEFLTLTHAGKKNSIQLTQLAAGAVLATVFDSKTTVGAVVFYLKEVVESVGAVLVAARDRKDKQVDLGAGFDDAAKGALDDMFGGDT